MQPHLAPYLQQFMPDIDVFLPSEKEINTLFGEETDLQQAASRLRSWGCSNVVIKRGARGGSMLTDNADHLVHFDAYHPRGDSRIVDVTGAGDSFCGGLVAGLAQGKNFDAAVQMGLRSASLTVEGYGALYPLRNTER